MSTENESVSVLDEVLGSAEDSDGNGGGENEGSVESGNPGIDPKQFSDLVSAVGGLQNQFGKWGKEIGDIRSLVSSSNPAPVEGGGDQGSSDIWNELMDDPEATLERKFAEYNQKQQSQAQQKASQSREQIKSYIPDFDSIQDDVVATIAKDAGVDKSQILQGLPNIDPAIIINVAKRVESDRKLAEVESLLSSMKNGGFDFDAAKRAMTRSPQSGDSFNPPRSTDTPHIDIGSLSLEQKRQMLVKKGIRSS